MEKETRVYVINCNETEFEFRKAEEEYKKNLNAIKDEAEKLGSVYSLSGFQNAINDESLDLGTSFILID